MSHINIRSMRIEDCAAAWQIERSAFPDSGWTLEDFQNALAAETQYYFVAEIDGTIVGFAALYGMLDTGDLVNIAVHQSVQRQGVATALMRTVLDVAVQMGLDTVTLEVREHNVSAIRLYEKLSFQTIAVRRGYYHNPSEDALIMQWHRSFL